MGAGATGRAEAVVASDAANAEGEYHFVMYPLLRSPYEAGHGLSRGGACDAAPCKHISCCAVHNEKGKSV